MKVGDRVVVYRKVEKQKGWEDSWVKGMDECVGGVGVITSLMFGGYEVNGGGRFYNFPPASLKYAK